MPDEKQETFLVSAPGTSGGVALAIPGSALVLIPREGLMDPDTGELLSEKSSDAAIAQGLAALNMLEALVAAERRRLSMLMTARMDRGVQVTQTGEEVATGAPSWTRRAGGVTMKTNSPTASHVWDPDVLRPELERLVTEGKITEAAAAACWLPVPPPKPSAKGINALLASLGKRDQARVRKAHVARKAGGGGERIVSVS